MPAGDLSRINRSSIRNKLMGRRKVSPDVFSSATRIGGRKRMRRDALYDGADG